MISGNDVLNEKEKLALEDLLQFALEKVKHKVLALYMLNMMCLELQTEIFDLLYYKNR